MKARRTIHLLLLAGLALPAGVSAQEGERMSEQEMAEAQQRVREAQRSLEQAMKELQAAQSEAANRTLREAIEEVRSAQRQLRMTGEVQRELLDRFRVERDWPGAVSVFVSENRPKMGVLLEESTFRSGADSIGVRLSGVTPGGPAEEAGLKSGDVIVSANGTALGRTSRRDPSPSAKLRNIIRELDEGQTLQVEYQRDGTRQSANVVLREIEPEAYAFSFASPESVDVRLAIPFLEELEGPERVRIRSGSPTILGGLMPFGLFDLELVSLNEELGRYFGTNEGLLVVRAPTEGLSGLQSGDVILTIDGRKPTSPSHALRIIRSYTGGESMSMDVMRNKRRQTITVTIPQRERGLLWEERE